MGGLKNLELRLLEYFVAVAELEHVGKAAERLHISQSPLSRQIRQLEKELQLELFLRERQRLRLTESGRWLLKQSLALIAQAKKVRAEAEQRSRGQLGTLSVAFTSAAMWSGILPDLLRRFQSQFPNATVELLSMRSALQFDAVRSGRADVGFVSYQPSRQLQPSLITAIEIICIWEEPLLLVLPNTHPLSGKRRIAARDLDGVGWILLSDTSSSERYDWFSATCANAGFTPKVVQKVMEPFTLLALVASGLGVGLIRSSARSYAPRSLTFVKLPWLSVRSRTYMIRPIAGRQPLAEAFAAAVPEIKGVVSRL